MDISELNMTEIEKLISSKNGLERVAFVLKTIGHPVRLKIIIMLAIDKKLTVNEICNKCGVEQSLISHHLNNMKLKGILNSERDGKHIYYFIILNEVLKVVDCMSNCRMS
jgi:DNA-binding transcriptional ArsR family regulator